MHRKPSTLERGLLLIASGVLLFLFVWFEWRLLLLSFAGLLLAILLDTLTALVQRRTRLNHILSFLITLACIGAIFAGAALLIVPRAVTQFYQLAVVIPQSLEQARLYLQHRAWGTSLLHLFHSSMHGISLGAKIPLLTAALAGGIVNLIVVLVIGFFGALNPDGYKNGILSLVPVAYRAQTRETSAALVETLRWWLLGQMVPMFALGIASMLALWILGVHLAFSLGLFTGFMVFVPYAGSILSGIPAILIALQRGPQTALLVLILYLIFHLTEGYLLTPLVQKKAVRLPPILTVLFQFFMWSFGGLLGVAVAAPLAAAGLVLVKQLYLRHSSGGPAQG